MTRLLLLLSFLLAVPAAAQEPSAAHYREDALSIEGLIERVYAYPERLPGGRYALTARLREEAERVSDRRGLLRFAERALLLLADHHAITGSSFADSYALVPSGTGIWIEARGGIFTVEAIRTPHPAIRAGDRLVAIDGVPIAEAVAAFWRDLGADPATRDGGFAARVLVAGRRNRDRRLSLQRGTAPPHEVELPARSRSPVPPSPPLTVTQEGRALRIRINDRLGDDDDGRGLRRGHGAGASGATGDHRSHRHAERRQQQYRPGNIRLVRRPPPLLPDAQPPRRGARDGHRPAMGRAGAAAGKAKAIAAG